MNPNCLNPFQQITHTQVRRLESALQKRHQIALAQHRIVNPPSKRRGAKTLQPPSTAAASVGGEIKGLSDSASRVPSDPLHAGGPRVLASFGLSRAGRRISTPSDENIDGASSLNGVLQEGMAAPGNGRRLTSRHGDAGGGVGGLGIGGGSVSHDRLKLDESDGTRSRGISPLLGQLPPPGPPSRHGGRVRPSSASLLGASHSLSLVTYP